MDLFGRLSGGTQIPEYVWYMLLLWSLIWKGLGLWQASREKAKYWFFAILVTNTIGILPLVYLLFFDKKLLKDLVKRFRP